MSIKITGIDNLEKQIDKLVRNAASLDENDSVPFDSLFTPSFMIEHTQFDSFDGFLDNGGFDVNSEADFEAIPDDVFDEYVRENSSFDSWQDMLNQAGVEYLQAKLFT
jgi:hypothetical protein